MPEVLEKKYLDDLTFALDCKVDSNDFQDFKNKVLEQIAKGIEVKGFRKGKAPVDVALKEADSQQVSATLMKEIIDRYSPEAIEESKKIIEKDGRLVLQYNVDYSPEFTKEDEDGGFQFRLVASLFAKIDLKDLDKIKAKEPMEKDIEGLPNFEDFKKAEIAKILLEQNIYEKVKGAAKKDSQVVLDMEGEVEGKKIESLTAKDFTVTLGAGMFLPDFEKEIVGLKAKDKKEFDLNFPKDYKATEIAGKTAKISVEIKEVKEAKYKNIEDLIANSEELKKYYKSIEELEADIKRVFDQRTEGILANARKKVAINEALKAIKDFPIDEKLAEAEVNRIFMLVKDDAEDKGLKIGEAFARSGLPRSEDPKVSKYDESEVKKAVENYVKDELKLTQVLAYIYETEVENKPTNKEISDIAKAAEGDKATYKIREEASSEEIRNTITDRVIRQLAGDWLINKIFKKEKGKTETASANKKTAKKPSKAK